MKFAISLFMVLVLGSFQSLANDFLEHQLRTAALQNNYLEPTSLNTKFDEQKAALGKKFFESKELSFNGNISCSSCHLDKFSSADGIPIAVGVGGHGSGLERQNGPGALVPRNTFALWGRSSSNFNAFFWDGKVELVDGKIKSQFLDSPPSDDPLLVAIHLPFLEIREMISDDDIVDEKYKKESIDAGLAIQNVLLNRIKAKNEIMDMLKKSYEIKNNELQFLHVADSVRHFFAKKFGLQKTKFSEFVFENGSLTEDEVRGGLIFYGKGMCSSCHSGPHFSDFKYHTILFPQLGPGKNGFGVDYGRFNVTFDYADKYKFRTPPLHNVSETKPYGHSGSLSNLSDAIEVHYDPIKHLKGRQSSGEDRRDFYSRAISTSSEQPTPAYLSPKNLSNVERFLKTLSFKDISN